MAHSGAVGRLTYRIGKQQYIFKFNYYVISISILGAIYNYNRDGSPNSPAPFFVARLACKFYTYIYWYKLYRPEGVAGHPGRQSCAETSAPLKNNKTVHFF